MPDRHLLAVVTGSSVPTEPIFATATRVLRAVGVEPGQRGLDFGCGHGNYVIPLARLAGPTGEVVAVDKDKRALERPAKRARAAGRANIERAFLSAERTLPLDDGLTEGRILTFRNGASPVNAIRLPE
jgi:precorrin-6B methylase 2